jgi:hypothetical protein
MSANHLNNPAVIGSPLAVGMREDRENAKATGVDRNRRDRGNGDGQ